MSWDVTRRQIRTLETKLDSSLNQYSRLAINITRADQGATPWPGSDVEEGRKGASRGGEDAMATENVVLEEEIERALSEVCSGKRKPVQQKEEKRRSHFILTLTLGSPCNTLQLSSAVSKLTTILDDPTVPPSSSQLYAVQRHREVLLDFERDYRRSRSNVKQALDRRDLLGSVKVDIE